MITYLCSSKQRPVDINLLMLLNIVNYFILNLDNFHFVEVPL